MKNELISSSTSVAEQRATVTETATKGWARFLSGRQGRRIRESLLAYLFLLPAFLIIGLFGIFPLIFAAYQSTLRGVNRVLGTYDGLGNYVNAIGNLTYVLGFGSSLLLVYLAIRMTVQARREAAAAEQPFWAWILPGTAFGAGLLLGLVWIFRLLPLLLAIPDQMRARRGLQQPFTVLAAQAVTDPNVLIVFWAAAASLLVGIFLTLFILRLYERNSAGKQPALRGRLTRTYSGLFTGVTAMLGVAVVIGLLTWVELQFRIAQAEQSGGLDVWSQILLISAGSALVWCSWVVWQSASDRPSNTGTALRLAGGAMLLVGAWLLIGELPRAIGSGDRFWWQGIQATFYYALGTVPLQLLFGLILAVLLFQDIKGRTFFRMVYFLPYIAPFVGTAAVFRIIFSARPNAPVNTGLGFLGLPTLQWLNEPSRVANLLLPEMTLPGWTAGPSLALVVIIIYGIWTFFGFNTVVFLAGLGNIPREMYEAASLDGASRWAQFRHITLPLLSPTIYFLTIYSVIGTFKAFNHIYVLRTGAALGTTDTASVVIFQMFKRDTRYGYASALAILLLVIIIVLTVINNRVASRRVHYG